MKEDHRNKHFDIKVDTPHKSMQDTGDEIQITYTTNGYQGNSIVLRKKEVTKMVGLIKQFYGD